MAGEYTIDANPQGTDEHAQEELILNSTPFEQVGVYFDHPVADVNAGFPEPRLLDDLNGEQNRLQLDTNIDDDSNLARLMTDVGNAMAIAQDEQSHPTNIKSDGKAEQKLFADEFSTVQHDPHLQSQTGEGWHHPH